jgi:hypothetical protein
VLPLYAKNRIPFDVYTYANIVKMQVTMRNLPEALKLYRKCKSQGITPNKALMTSSLEAALRLHDTDAVYECLEDFVA